jgi:hypothetical protein
MFNVLWAAADCYSGARASLCRAQILSTLAADADIKKTGEVYVAADVRAWMKRLATDESAARPKPWRRQSMQRGCSTT